MSRPLIPHLALISSGALFGLVSVTVAQGNGDLLQVTSQMSMVGLPIQMPAQTQQVCSARNWTTAPAGSGPDQTCRNTDFSMSGNNASWKITCQSPPATGIGQITRNGDDAYAGSIKFT